MILDMADVKPTLYSWAVVTLMALAGIVALKVLMYYWPVPGLKDIVNLA